jgi:integrase
MRKMITERMVKSVKPAAATYIIYDTQIRGFGVRVTPTGTVSFVLNYSVHGRERRLTLGRYPEISAAMARQEALDRRREIYDGHDPLAERNRARAVPTVAQFSEEYLQRHAEPEKRPISVRDDRRRLKATIVPRLGKLAVDAVTGSDVEALRRDMASRPVEFNRVRALLHTMFELAARWGYVGNGFSNPARGVRKYREEERKQWVSEVELNRLLQVLDSQPDQEAADAVRLLLLTGSRKNEVLGATWEQFDLGRGVWTKPSHSTKEHKTEVVPLSEAARDLLTSMASRSSPRRYLFPGRNGSHRKDLKRFWAKVSIEAHLQGVHPEEGVHTHDLRHTFASHLVSAGVSLAKVGALIGHTQARTTQRYAHLADQALRNVTNQFGAIYRSSSDRARARAAHPVTVVKSIRAGKK